MGGDRFALAIATASLLMAEVPKQARAAIDRAIGSPGTYHPEEGVYKIVLPQPEATVVLDYQTLSPAVSTGRCNTI